MSISCRHRRVMREKRHDFVAAPYVEAPHHLRPSCGNQRARAIKGAFIRSDTDFHIGSYDPVVRPSSLLILSKGLKLRFYLRDQPLLRASS